MNKMVGDISLITIIMNRKKSLTGENLEGRTPC